MRLLSVYMLLMGLQIVHAYQVKDDLSLSKSLERLKPDGEVKVSGKSDEKQQTQAILEPGQAVVQKYCSVCHGQGIAGAPKIGDKAAWSAKATQGLQQLVHHAVVGYKAMPAKGHCTKCTDQDIQEAIEYMLKKSDTYF